jgi:hypothetical protein
MSIHLYLYSGVKGNRPLESYVSLRWANSTQQTLAKIWKILLLINTLQIRRKDLQVKTQLILWVFILFQVTR